MNNGTVSAEENPAFAKWLAEWLGHSRETVDASAEIEKVVRISPRRKAETPADKDESNGAQTKGSLSPDRYPSRATRCGRK